MSRQFGGGHLPGVETDPEVQLPSHPGVVPLGVRGALQVVDEVAGPRPLLLQSGLEGTKLLVPHGFHGMAEARNRPEGQEPGDADGSSHKTHRWFLLL